MKSKKRLLMILMAITIILSACTANNPLPEPGAIEPETPPIQVKDPIAEQIKSMTLEEKLSQMMVVGLTGHTADEKAIQMIEQYKIGGFILYGSNVESSDQLLRLINSLKRQNASNQLPLFISVDEEGGRISRMPKEFKDLPTSKAIGRVDSETFSFNIGKLLAEEIKAFGFNMNFAPVLDINSNPKNPVIGDRAFGSEEAVVSSLGLATMRGMQSQNVIPVIKHFPGHGDTSVDSHVGLPSVDNNLQRLTDFELLPFDKAVKAGADVVMVAHILLPKIDADNPATLSKTIITDLLRRQLDFDGVVITDDMTMGAIVENYDMASAAVKSVAAGSDIILVAHGYDNAISVLDALKEAVADGIITEERVNESVYRIITLKKEYGLNNEEIDSIDVEHINEKIDTVLQSYMK